MTETFIRIGKIVSAQGRRGDVRVLPLTDFPERFNEMDSVQVFLPGRRLKYHIEEVRRHRKQVVIKFKEINDMDAAQGLRGGLLEVSRGELVALPEDSYYIFELVGLRVYDRESGYLGQVVDVIRTGSNDVYIVEDEGKTVLIPAIKKVIKEVDLTGQRMAVELPEGLAD